MGLYGVIGFPRTWASKPASQGIVTLNGMVSSTAPLMSGGKGAAPLLTAWSCLLAILGRRPVSSSCSQSAS